MALEEFYEGEMSASTAIEEVLAYLSILALLFVCIVLPFEGIISRLDQKLSWKGHFFQRFAIEASAVLTCSGLFGVFFGYFIHLYIDHSLPTGSVIFRTILFLLITSSIIMALLELRRINEEKDKLFLLSQQLEKEKVETLYNSLKQQVNPHFLFNSLSVLSSLVHYDAQKADLFIQHFSDIYRYVLNLNKRRLVTLEEELQFLHSYLFLQRIRFGDHIKIESSLNEQHQLLNIPPLTLQLVFENILKHNIISKENPMKVIMQVKENRLIIENQLNPRKDVKSTGLGLANLEEKYQLLKERKPIFKKEEDRYSVALPLLQNS